MRTPKGDEIEKNIDELRNSFENYLRPLFDEWKRVVSEKIQEKIMYPLFIINDDKKIEMNFAKEVIIIYFLITQRFTLTFCIFDLFEA